VRSAARQRIKERTIVRQKQQRKVFYISFTIFTTVYTIILAFIGATFKFIEIMATALVKGLSGILGLFYNNSKGAERGEESKQPIKPRVSPKLGDTIPTLTPTTSGTDNSQQIEDKGYKVHLPIPRESIGPLYFTRPPME